MEQDYRCVGEQQREQENHESEQIGEQKSSRRRPSTHWGNPRVQREPEGAIGRQHRQEHAQRDDTQTPAPAIDGRLALDFQWRSGGTKEERLAADACDLVSNLANEGLGLSSSAQRILASVAEQKAQTVDLETIGDILRILSRQQSAQVFKKYFACAMVTEELFLQRTLRPIREDWTLQPEHAFIEECYQGKDG